MQTSAPDASGAQMLPARDVAARVDDRRRPFGDGRRLAATGTNGDARESLLRTA
jgi:hypothetical protein